MKKKNKSRIFAFISFGFLGVMLVLLCLMGLVAQATGGEGVINAVLKISMYAAFGVSVAFFVVSYIIDTVWRNNGRK